jgi:DEAD/DEAH box helicase domain-containing protein
VSETSGIDTTETRLTGATPSVVAQQLRRTLLDYLETTFALADPVLERALFDFLDSEHGLFRGPFVDLRLPYRKAPAGSSVPLEIAPSFRPYMHQVRSFERLSSAVGRVPKPTLVTTGTGSGKTECFLYPILDHCFRLKGEPGIKAILIYPMNALATDQARRLARVLWDDARLKGIITAGLYVGGKGTHGAADRDHLVDQRDVLRVSPPDILLTNYKMLDYLLVRPEDRKLWANNGPDTLRYLVLDELHTYDGAQGADVACLIRRLKDRLRVPTGRLCCVGTSATLGEKTEASSEALASFASKVFEEPIGVDAVVVEDRLAVNEAFPEVPDLDAFPAPDQEADLVAEDAYSADAWAAAQCDAWCGDGAGALDPVELGRRLERHAFLRQVLRALDGRVVDVAELDEKLCARDVRYAARVASVRRRILDSLFGVVSRARRVVDSRIEPFLTTMSQLWVRELHHLVVKVPWPGEPYEFRFYSDPTSQAAAEHASSWLPLAYCRECGAVGFAAAQRESESTLLDDPAQIGRIWKDRSREARFILPGAHDGDELQRYLDPSDLHVGLEARHRDRNGEERDALPVLVGSATSDDHMPRFLARCPACENDRALSMLGSRAASLLSVAIGQLFQTDFISDKKLLAFCDSVQDASHRAGFFGARTYRFNLRIGFQRVLEESEADIPLADVAARARTLWDERLGTSARIATFLPVDLLGLTTAQEFVERNGDGDFPELDDDLARRLSWEAVLEFGHNSKIGRSLEQTSCSAIAVPAVEFEKAVEQVHLELRESNILPSRMGGDIQPENVRSFLSCLVHRVRARGGVCHPFLDAYVKDLGNSFLLTKGKNPLLSPFGSESRLPRFLVERTLGPKRAVFDAFTSAPNKRTWFRDYAARAIAVQPTDEGINELFRIVVRRLEGAGLLRRIEGKEPVWGLDPEKLFVTRKVATACCDTCARAFVIAIADRKSFERAVCPHFRCRGRLRIEALVANTYYTRIYRSKSLRGIRAEEHTGLLSRKKREQLEDRFKSGSGPYAPNLFVCSPTLEMGIDIGDLSATVLCTVPPAPANYLQRIGRAGRSTGNAIVLTVAESRPHDLYFFAQPTEMLAGEVRPPGCFLDAPEMLKRQLIAHAMDAWARDAKPAPQIPRQVSAILGQKGDATFPGSFLTFYAGQHEALTSAFISRFGQLLSPAHRMRLEEFAVPTSIASVVRKAFDEVEIEIAELRGIQRKARERIDAITQNPEGFEDPVEEKSQAAEVRVMAGRLIEELGKKYPLNVLTDAGVLPNYAFPEPGVELKSVVWDKKGDGTPRYEVYEYQRPASSALREMAPFNTFYAEGRHVQIDEIDLGTKAQSRIEHWRFCAECAHMAREIPTEPPATACPRCADSQWPDAGQARSLVHFRRARSLSSRLETATTDDSDDRIEEHYVTLDLIDVAPEHGHGAWLIEAMPFGIELLRDLPMREVNVQRALATKSQGSKINGCEVGDGGFDVCRDCGRVFGPEHQASKERQRRHSATCRARRSGQTESMVRLHLYREVTSEAIRILVPAADFDVDRRRASLRAALQLGIRRHFGGNPAHLQMKTMSEPIVGAAGKRHFLVIFDAVPGGTGQLAEIWHGEKGGGFLAMLEKALAALRTCVCRLDATRDGCYRCVFAYTAQRDFPFISSRLAEEMLSEVLRRATELEWKSARTLSDVSMSTRLESELEARFLEALTRRLKRDGWIVREKVLGGEVRWEVRKDGDGGATARAWEIRAQVDLGRTQGVDRACRPDFMISPLGKTPGMPVAVFCDGLAYHACPTEARGRIHDDITKRTSILGSGQYRVWSVTWKDVEDVERGAKPDRDAILFATVDSKKRAVLEQGQSMRLAAAVALSGSVEQLIEYLGLPDASAWSRLASVMTVGWLFTPGKFVPPEFAETLEHRLLEERGAFDVGPIPQVATTDSVFSRFEEKGHLRVLVRCAAIAIQGGKIERAHVVMRLHDDLAARSSSEFEPSWRRFLHAWNLLQFLDDVVVVSTEEVEIRQIAVDEPVPLPIAADVIGRRHVADVSKNPEVRAILDAVDESVWPIVAAVEENGMPLPVPAYELATKGKSCGPEAELTWPELKLAVLVGPQVEDRSVFESAGFAVISNPSDSAAVLTQLTQRLSAAKPDRQGGAA